MTAKKIIVGQLENSGCPITAELKDSDHFLWHSRVGDIRWKFDGKTFTLQQCKMFNNRWFDIPCFIDVSQDAMDKIKIYT